MDKITKPSKSSPYYSWNIIETAESETKKLFDREIPKEGYVPLGKAQGIIDKQWLI